MSPTLSLNDTHIENTEDPSTLTKRASPSVSFQLLNRMSIALTVLLSVLPPHSIESRTSLSLVLLWESSNGNRLLTSRSLQAKAS